MIDEDTPLYDEEAEALNELQCPKCLTKLKMIGRSGFCENKKCTVYEILFKRQEMTKEQKEFIELSSQVLNKEAK